MPKTTTLFGNLPQTYFFAPYVDLPSMGIMPPRSAQPVISGGPYIGHGGENVGAGDSYTTVARPKIVLPDIPRTAVAYARAYRLREPIRMARMRPIAHAPERAMSEFDGELARRQHLMRVDVLLTRMAPLLKVDTVLGPRKLDVDYAIRNMIVSTDAWVGALGQLDALALKDGRPPSSMRIIWIISQSKHPELQVALRELAHAAVEDTNGLAFCYLVEFALNLVPDAKMLLKLFDADTLCSLVCADVRVDKLLRLYPQLFGDDTAADALTRVFEEGFADTEMLVEPASAGMKRETADGDDGSDGEPSGGKLLPFKQPE